MVRRFLQTHRYPSGSTRGEVEKILRNRGWGPRNDLPDDGGGDIGHDVKAGRQAKTGRAGLGLGRVTHAGQIDARLCVLALGRASPGASLRHSDGRQDYDARRKSAAAKTVDFFGILAPKGPKQISPGQRPGWPRQRIPGSPEGAKQGENRGLATTLFRPFRAEISDPVITQGGVRG